MMAIVSVGYDGTVDETQWAHLVAKAGSSEYGVDLAGDFEVTPVAGVERTIRIAPGKAWGHGVLDVMDVEQTIQVDASLSGDRYDMVVLRRDWQPPGGATVLAIIQGSSSSVNIPARNTGTLGILDDQPIALIRVVAGSTTVSVAADLRVWARNGGATAKDTRTLQYIGALGTSVEINKTLWSRRIGSAGAEWVKLLDANDTGWVHLNSGFASGWGNSTDYIRYRVQGNRCELYVTVTRTGGTIGVGATGNIGNTHIATAPPSARPAAWWKALTSGPAGALASASIDQTGKVTLNATVPSVNIVKGNAFQFHGTYFID